MDSPHSFNMWMLRISWAWEFFGSRFLIIPSILFISKVMEDKDSLEFRGNSGGILLFLFKIVHSFKKWELNISVFVWNLW